MNKILILFLLLIILGSIINGLELSIERDLNIQKNNENYNQIVIDGNKNLTSIAKNQGWSGNGNKSTPILISSFITPYPIYLILKNTNLSFAIQDFNLKMSNSLEVNIQNVSNGLIINNNFIGTKSVATFWITNSTNTLISNNNFNDFTVTSFNIFGSTNVSIIGNTFKNEYQGIFSVSKLFWGIYIQANNSIVKDNSFVHAGIDTDIFINKPYGYGVDYLNNTLNGKPILVLQNKTKIVETNKLGQIILIDDHNITIKDQNISFVYHGFFSINCANITIKNSTFSNLLRRLEFTNVNNSVFENNVINNTVIYWTRSQNNVITNNTIASLNLMVDNSTGMDYFYLSPGLLEYASNHFTISFNDIIKNRFSGLEIVDSSFNTIKNNKISNNGFNGIELKGNTEGSNNNTIKNNEIFNNIGYGISLDVGSFYNTITGNSIYDNIEGGINDVNAKFNNVYGNQINSKGNNNDYSLFIIGTACIVLVLYILFKKYKI